MRAPFRLGIDLGGTKTEIIALEGSDERLRHRLPTPQGDYRATLHTIVQLVSKAERQLGDSGSIGIGIPGTRSPDHGRIKNANSTCLNGQDLQGDLEHLLQRPVRLANDADCFALSEATDGAGAGSASVFGVILGTGVGGGIVIHGRLLSGPNAIAGEWVTTPCPGATRKTARRGAAIAAWTTASKPSSAAPAGPPAATWG
jgi:fructokinase